MPELTRPLCVSEDDLIEIAARAAYALGDHLNTWDDASKNLREAYESAIVTALALWPATSASGYFECDECGHLQRVTPCLRPIRP